MLGILLVTQEWGQRTGMVTFTLEPIRRRVILAKVLAALLLGLAAVVLALVVAAVCAALFGSSDALAASASTTSAEVPAAAGAPACSRVSPSALLLLNTAAAIVVYFVVPLAFNDPAEHVGARAARPAAVDRPQHRPGSRCSARRPRHRRAVGPAGHSALIWVVLPFVLGLWRVLRAEVK